MSYFSQKIKALRLAHNYSQKEVAKGVGVSQGTYSDLESGKNDPSLSTLQKLSDFYEELIDSLVQPFRIVEDNGLSDEEHLLLKKIRRLSSDDRLEVKLIVDMKIEKARKRSEDENGDIDPIKMDNDDVKFLYDNEDAIIFDLKKGNPNG